MKNSLLLVVLIAALLSCKKSGETPATPTPTPTPVDNGPLGGSYTFKSSLVETNDTTVEPPQFPGQPSFEISVKRVYTSTSVMGKLTITASNLKSEGLINNYSILTTGNKKNLTTGVVTAQTYLPSSDSRGISTSSFNSNYTFSIAGSQMNLVDGQYIFLPSFQIQPTDKKYNYTVIGSDLIVTYEYYSSTDRSKSKTTSVFTKN